EELLSGLKLPDPSSEGKLQPGCQEADTNGCDFKYLNVRKPTNSPKDYTNRRPPSEGAAIAPRNRAVAQPTNF
ncbi:hypothetical protein K2X33_10030, partial [bacterium]|nr:hypothetical protein [bacterium]